MKAEIITIGDEILIGQIVDTNSAWMGQQLNLIGIRVHQITSVSDNREHILTALAEASKRADVVLITGGLGPTKDDITKLTLCDYFKVKLRFDESAFADIEHVFKIRGREVNDTHRRQAELPENCITLHNKVGTAPGMWFEEKGCVYVSMPGVPWEMQYLFDKEVIPRIKEKFETPFILHKTFLTQGVGETVLADLLEDLENNLPSNFKLAYLPSAGMVRLRLTAMGEKKDVTAKMDRLSAEVSALIAEHLYGYGEESLEEVLGKVLREKNLTVSTAESCTGGNIAHMITSVAGSSTYYMGSTVTYSYESKSDLLGVPVDVIKKHGAVSSEVVEAMAKGVRERFNTDCGIATSGIAGPSGGTADKPVGTVWIAISTPKGTISKKVMLGDNRLRVIQVASITAINMLRKALLS